MPNLAAEEQSSLNGVAYQGIVCASLLLKKSLATYYVTNITDDWVPFTAVIEMSTLVDRNEFGGNSLVYLPKYVAPDDPHFRLSDDEIRERFVAALEKMYPHFTRDDVLAFRVSRVRHVFAVSTLNYSDRVPPMSTSVPGVYLVNSAHIVNGTLNVNETLTLAESVLPVVLARNAANGGRGGLMDKPLASLSLDLDNQWSYMKTHGDPGWESLPSYLGARRATSARDSSRATANHHLVHRRTRCRPCG